MEEKKNLLCSKFLVGKDQGQHAKWKYLKSLLLPVLSIGFFKDLAVVRFLFFFSISGLDLPLKSHFHTLCANLYWETWVHTAILCRQGVECRLANAFNYLLKAEKKLELQSSAFYHLCYWWIAPRKSARAEEGIKKESLHHLVQVYPPFFNSPKSSWIIWLCDPIGSLFPKSGHLSDLNISSHLQPK